MLLAVLMVFFLVNLSISGALLVFGKEIQNQLQPLNLQVSHQMAPLPLSQLVAIVEADSGKTAKKIQLKTTKKPGMAVYVK